jgi:hypothetical protein
MQKRHEALAAGVSVIYRDARPGTGRGRDNTNRVLSVEHISSPVGVGDEVTLADGRRASVVRVSMDFALSDKRGPGRIQLAEVA